MEQQALPLAIVRGEKFTEQPLDLFIPDDALEVHLEAFEGPLDLLLYLIKKQKFDIVDLPIASISQQYFHYIEQIEQHNIDLSSEYLVMAASLAHIKSRLLLPAPELTDDEEDPRAELVRKLIEYQKIKQAAEQLETLPREEREFFSNCFVDTQTDKKTIKETNIDELVSAFKQVLKKQAVFEHHHIQKETISTQDKLDYIVKVLRKQQKPLLLTDLVIPTEGKQGVLVTFLALLELLKLNIIQCKQSDQSIKVVLV